MRCGNVQCKTNKKAKYVLTSMYKTAHRKNKQGRVLHTPIPFTGIEVLFACKPCTLNQFIHEWKEDGGLVWFVTETVA